MGSETYLYGQKGAEKNRLEFPEFPKTPPTFIPRALFRGVMHHWGRCLTLSGCICMLVPHVITSPSWMTHQELNLSGIINIKCIMYWEYLLKTANLYNMWILMTFFKFPILSLLDLFKCNWIGPGLSSKLIKNKWGLRKEVKDCFYLWFLWIPKVCWFVMNEEIVKVISK